MDRLDSKLIDKILWMVSREDQKNLLRVSKQWYQNIDELIGIDVVIGRGTGLTSGNEALDSIQVLEKVGIRSCRLDDYINDSSIAVPNLKHPNLLKLFSISNFVSTKTLQSILTRVTNLHTFKIGPNALCHLEFSDMAFFTFPCQVLEIHGVECNKYDRIVALLGWIQHDLRRFEVASNNLLYLLRKSFPGLKRLKMKLRILEEMYQQFIHELSNFLNNHADTLMEVTIGRYKDSFISKPEFQPIPPELEPYQVPDRQFNTLKKIEYRHEIPSSELQNEMTWAERATNLEQIFISFLDPEGFLKSIMSKNETTLMLLDIGFLPGWKITSFDCDVLRNCGNLRFFKIYCRMINSETFSNESTVKLLNTASLPNTISALCIICLRVESEQCEALFHNLPDLRRVSLLFNGEPGSGVPSHIVREILLKKKIEKFKLTVADDGTEDYSAYTRLPIKTSRQHPLDKDQIVFAVLNDEKEYQITKFSV